MAGKRLSALLRRHPSMPSDHVMAMLAQRGASSLNVRSSGGATKAGAKETSRAVEPILDITGDGLRYRGGPPSRNKHGVPKD